jgi:hypothetical protein
MMAEPKWSTAPWHVGKPLTRLSDLGPIETSVVVDDTLDHVCHILKNGPANARLIAAGPELYVAASAARERMGSLCRAYPDDGWSKLVLRALDAALAKARGE